MHPNLLVIQDKARPCWAWTTLRSGLTAKAAVVYFGEDTDVSSDLSMLILKLLWDMYMNMSGRLVNTWDRSLGARYGYTLRFGRHHIQMAIKIISVDRFTTEKGKKRLCLDPDDLQNSVDEHRKYSLHKNTAKEMPKTQNHNRRELWKLREEWASERWHEGQCQVLLRG